MNSSLCHQICTTALRNRESCLFVCFPGVANANQVNVLGIRMQPIYRNPDLKDLVEIANRADPERKHEPCLALVDWKHLRQLLTNEAERRYVIAIFQKVVCQHPGKLHNVSDIAESIQRFLDQDELAILRKLADGRQLCRNERVTADWLCDLGLVEKTDGGYRLFADTLKKEFRHPETMWSRIWRWVTRRLGQYSVELGIIGAALAGVLALLTLGIAKFGLPLLGLFVLVLLITAGGSIGEAIKGLDLSQWWNVLPKLLQAAWSRMIRRISGRMWLPISVSILLLLIPTYYRIYLYTRPWRDTVVVPPDGVFGEAFRNDTFSIEFPKRIGSDDEIDVMLHSPKSKAIHYSVQLPNGTRYADFEYGKDCNSDRVLYPADHACTISIKTRNSSGNQYPSCLPIAIDVWLDGEQPIRVTPPPEVQIYDRLPDTPLPIRSRQSFDRWWVVLLSWFLPPIVVSTLIVRWASFLSDRHFSAETGRRQTRIQRDLTPSSTERSNAELRRVWKETFRDKGKVVYCVAGREPNRIRAGPPAAL